MGAESLMPVGHVLQRPASVRLRVGEPIEHESIQDSIRKNHPNSSEHELCQRVMTFYMSRIEELLDRDYRNQAFL